MRGDRNVHRRWDLPVLENGVVDRLQILVAEEESVCRLARYLGGSLLVDDKGPHFRANAVRYDNDVALKRLPVEEVNGPGLRILPQAECQAYDESKESYQVGDFVIQQDGTWFPSAALTQGFALQSRVQVGTVDRNLTRVRSVTRSPTRQMDLRHCLPGHH
jgi:hypothetical protein